MAAYRSLSRSFVPSLISFLLLLNIVAPFLDISPVGIVEAAPSTPFESYVPVRGTYLFADNSAVEWDDNGDGIRETHGLELPLILNITNAGLKPGDKIRITFQGEIHISANASWSWISEDPSMLGVFSSTKEILWVEQNGEVGPLRRVPGAINAGMPEVTEPTFQEYPTDIPEDFLIPKIGTEIKVPQGSAWLFLCFYDVKYPDNDGWLKVTIEKDSDGDCLWDSWETKGIDSDGDGVVDLKLEGADPQHKDIYVEVDYMQGHRLSSVARDNIVQAFENAPVSNPDNNKGINIHIEIDDSDNIVHTNTVQINTITGSWPDFDTIKASYLGTRDQRKNSDIIEAKRMAYHYCLMIHNYATFNTTLGRYVKTTSGGIAEPYGNDFIVSLGDWTGGVGSSEEQAGTFMHELGHNLGLRHGGGDDINYKPNYLSIMNYLFQVPYAPLVRGLQAPLSYSSVAQPELVEKKLDESKGIGAFAPWLWTAYSAPLKTTQGTKMVPLIVSTRGPIDWNNNGDDSETDVWANINYYIGYPKNDSPNDETLRGNDDWSKLRFNFRETIDYQDRIHSSMFGVDELDWETVQALREYFSQNHNVAAIGLQVPEGKVGKNGFNVDLILANFGGSNETSTITVLANTTSVASMRLSLSRFNFTALRIPCSIEGLRLGFYKVTVRISTVENETYVSDNIITGGIVRFVDVTPPTTVAEYDGTLRRVDFTVTLTASDDLSGVLETYYVMGSESRVKKVSVDGAPRFTTEGMSNEMRYWSEDFSGNVEQAKVLTGVKLDKSPPTLTISSPTSGMSVGSSSFTMTWTGLDSVSGIRDYGVKLDGGAWIAMGKITSYELTGMGEGGHVVDVRASDAAGNTVLASITFTVDTRPWLIPVLGGLAIVVLVALILLARRRLIGRAKSASL